MKHSFVLAFSLLSAVSFVEADDLNVLFLGDNGHHQPKARFDDLQPALADDGIVLTYTDDVQSALTAANLAKYDTLLLYANIDDIAPENAVALLRYVDNGGGFVPLHCATYCFRNNEDVVALMGGQFLRHGTGTFSTIPGDISHPIMQGFGGFSSWDETYLHHKHNEANRTVLEYRRGEPQAEGQKQEPWTWVRTHGEGRVFYTAWGHDERTWTNPGFQNLVERGIRWTCKVDPGEAGDFGERDRFIAPEMTKIPEGLPPFDYVDVGPKIPNYTPGAQWGTQEKPKTLMQTPLSPEESMQHYVTPVDFELELYAAEGDLGGKPIAMNWDEHGRLWVCETIDYPNELKPQNRGRDRIRVCEDTDGDGKADKFTVFAEDLSIPTSVCPWNDGVIVQNGTETLYLKDTDGDGKADMRHVLISNWELGDTHGGVSNLRFGLDNWIWGMQGYNNSAVVINGEKQLPFRMGFFRFQLDNSMPPKVTKLEFMRSTDNNTWGLGISEEGLIFGSTANHNPSTFMPIPNRYYEQVKGWSSDRLRTIADSHLFDPITDKVRQVDHHGGYTAGAGHALYTARTYPQQWWNRTAFVAGPTGHLVGTFVLSPDGAGYTSTSPTNLVASDDEWAAPIMAEVGPDGNVWVLDWYNYIVQHNPTPQGFETGKGAAYESDLRDKKYGRVYRVVYGDGSNDAPAASLKRDDVDSLIAGLSHPSMTVRLAAQRLLVEEQATPAIPKLIELTKSSEVDSIGLNVAAIHALQTLNGLGALEGDSAAFEAAVAALKHRSPGVRRNAAQVLPSTDAAREALIASGILIDADAQAALAGVLALADMPSSDVGDKVIGVINGRVGSDRWLADAATSAAATHAVSFLKSLGGSADGFLNARMLPITRTIAEHFARSKPSGAEVDEVFSGLAGGESVLIAQVLSGFTAGWPKDHTVKLSNATDVQLAKLFDSVPTEVRASLVQLASSLNSDALLAKTAEIAESLLEEIEDADLQTPARLAAAKNLVSLTPKSEDTLDSLLEQISGAASPDFATGVLAAIGAMDADLIAEPLAELVSLATPAVREAAIQTLLARPQTTAVLLDSIEAGDVAPSDLSLVQRQLLTSLPNRNLRRRAEELMKKAGGSVNADRQRVLDSKLFLTEQSGSVAAGRVVYEKNCAACHVYRGLGKKVGPVLDGMAVHPKKELLTHILDPNRNVEGNYRLYTVVTSEGMVLNGMLANETRTTIQIVDSKGESKSVLREEIEEIIPSRKSIMPEGFESNISDQGLVDLLTFLTDIGDYLPVPLESSANVVSTRGMFYDRNGLGERIIFDDWGMKAFEGVPFRLIDPSGDSQPNMVMLRSPNGPLTRGLIESVRIPANTPAKAIHLLSGIGGWAARGPGDRGVAMVVRLIYADGQTEDHKLIDGQHFADYNGLFDVPESKLAFKTNGGNYQVRYLAVKPRRDAKIESIEFAKGDNNTAPIVVAATIEPLKK